MSILEIFLSKNDFERIENGCDLKIRIKGGRGSKINGIATDTPFANAKIVDHSEVIELIKQLDEPQPIKLKNVTARIKQLDIGTRKVWLDEFLNELGSDYGTLKYKAGYEQGKFDGAVEREKVQVPQFVADWYEENKDDFELNLWLYLTEFDEENIDMSERFGIWLGDEDNNPIQTLVNMHQFGYEVEEEKRYLVKMKGFEEEYNFLNYFIIQSDANNSNYRTHHTRKELEQAGFGWVFDCPGVEIEEVQDDSKI